MKQNKIIKPYVRTAVNAGGFLSEIVAHAAVKHGFSPTDYSYTALNAFGTQRNIGIHILITENIFIDPVGKSQVTIVKDHGNIGGQKD